MYSDKADSFSKKPLRSFIKDMPFFQTMHTSSHIVYAVIFKITLWDSS